MSKHNVYLTNSLRNEIAKKYRGACFQGYLESAKKVKARPDILNQPIDKEYESRWRVNVGGGRNDESVFFAGRMNVAGGRALVPT